MYEQFSPDYSCCLYCVAVEEARQAHVNICINFKKYHQYKAVGQAYRLFKSNLWHTLREANRRNCISQSLLFLRFIELFASRNETQSVATQSQPGHFHRGIIASFQCHQRHSFAICPHVCAPYSNCSFF